MAMELLLELKEGAAKGSTKLEGVEKILSKEEFMSGEGLLTTLKDGSTLLHLAASSRDERILPLVCQAYKRAKFFSQAMLMVGGYHKLTPLHITVRIVSFESFVLLYKDSQELCPEALQPLENGCTLYHTALDNPENLHLLKFLLSQKETLPMLLSEYGNKLPLHCAKSLVKKQELFVKVAEDGFKLGNLHQMQYNFVVLPKKKLLEKAKEMLTLIQQLTMELKAEQSKKHAVELERQKMLERQGQLKSELNGLILAESWQEIEEKYVLAGMEETRKISVMYLAEKLESDASCFSLVLSDKILQALVELMNSSNVSTDSEQVVLSAMKLLEFYTTDSKSNRVIIDMAGSLPILPKVLDTLSSMDSKLQCTCARILANFYSNQPANSTLPSHDDTATIQPLILVKTFSLSEQARSFAGEALKHLGVAAAQEADPGTWSARQVCFWLESSLEIEGICEYSKQFLAAGIDGLHLLELSPTEMTGLGVKFVSHQRKLTACIDDLRRRNMRKMVGKRDVFLSYAHIDIHFARKIKSGLNEEGYSVWIDEAGIRAGHKWRNEIADGIQNASCVLFIMTPRSANSVYCQDEIGLAEEYHKPIFTVKHTVFSFSEMDPGLKLTLQRRQWLDFSDRAFFPENMKSLVSAIHSIIGPGSGVQPDQDNQEQEAADDALPSQPGATPPGSASSSLQENNVRQLVWEMLSSELSRFREEVRAEISRLDLRLDEIARRVDWK